EGCNKSIGPPWPRQCLCLSVCARIFLGFRVCEVRFLLLCWDLNHNRICFLVAYLRWVVHLVTVCAQHCVCVCVCISLLACLCVCVCVCIYYSDSDMVCE